MDKKKAQELLKGLYNLIDTRVQGSGVEHNSWKTVYKALDAFIAGPAIESETSSEGVEGSTTT